MWMPRSDRTWITRPRCRDGRVIVKWMDGWMNGWRQGYLIRYRTVPSVPRVGRYGRLDSQAANDLKMVDAADEPRWPSKVPQVTHPGARQHQAQSVSDDDDDVRLSLRVIDRGVKAREVCVVSRWERTQLRDAGKWARIYEWTCSRLVACAEGGERPHHHALVEGMRSAEGRRINSCSTARTPARGQQAKCA